MHRYLLYILGLFIGLPGLLSAQRVMYSESFNARFAHHQVIGKSGKFYWLETRRKNNNRLRKKNESSPDVFEFTLLDDKLKSLNTFAPDDKPDRLKQWMVAGQDELAQLIVRNVDGKTRIYGIRFSVTGARDSVPILLDSLPFTPRASGMILTRSADQTKILLLAFQNSDPSLTQMHAILFDATWHPLYHRVIAGLNFSQPFIQDDDDGLSSESYDNSPLKLANTGEWIMTSPSRESLNYSIIHVPANGIGYRFKEFPISPYYKMEDMAMYIDRDQRNISVGLLSGYPGTTLKNVQICNYDLNKGMFVFDSSFHFNTQRGDIRNKNICHERFVAVPGSGYIFLKEYGSPYDFEKAEIPVFDFVETAYLYANDWQEKTVKGSDPNGYRFARGLSPTPIPKNRGDLNFFYFPAVSKDSTWTGGLGIEQHSESNNPDLSYLFMPGRDKLFMIYNTPDGYSDPLATATTLDIHGQETVGGMLFWKMKKSLNFQRARRISAAEVAVPYPMENGFAIIQVNPENL